MNFDNISWPIVLLYGVLGALLAVAGVTVLDKPVEYVTILATVVAIDFLSDRHARK
jgi:uncharacterized membrane protein HdeD (DUF308 family)